MKKLLTILAVLIVSINGFSQSIVGRSNSSYTVMDSRFMAQYNLFVPRYADSTAANVQIGIDTCGAVVYLYSTHSLWYRSCASDTKKWVEIGSGGGGGGMTNPMTTIGDIIVGGASGAAQRLGIGTAAFVLTSNGAGSTPTWQAIPSDNLIVQRGGEVSGSVQSWWTSGDTLYLKDLKGSTYIGVTTSADSANIVSLLQADYGDITVGASTWTIDNDVVTYAKFQNVGANEVIGRAVGSSGDVSGIAIGASQLFGRGATGDLTAITLGTNLSMSGTTLNATGGGGGGDVTKVGTPVNNQLGVWTGDGTIEGDANLTFASSTLNIGVAGASTGILTQSGVTSGTITFQPASAAGTYTLTWPTNDGDASQVLTTDGSGVLSWATPSGSVNTFSISASGGNNTTLTDAATMYIGSYATAQTSAATNHPIYIDRTCTMKSIVINSFASTAGTGENWLMYVRVNNTTDYLIEDLAVAANNRVWDNSAMNISLSAGDEIIIKNVQPTWATNPASAVFSFYAVFEY